MASADAERVDDDRLWRYGIDHKKRRFAPAISFLPLQIEHVVRRNWYAFARSVSQHPSQRVKNLVNSWIGHAGLLQGSGHGMILDDVSEQLHLGDLPRFDLMYLRVCPRNVVLINLANVAAECGREHWDLLSYCCDLPHGIMR